MAHIGGIARADRICLYCFTQLNRFVVEDEYYVFSICFKFNDMREYLHTCTWYRSAGDSKNQFFDILNTSNPV